MPAKLKVAILGSTGMLGSMVRRVLGEHPEYDLRCPPRKELDAAEVTATDLYWSLRDCEYVINCIGIIKPGIDESDSMSVRQAVRVNALFPYLLADAAGGRGFKVIQIATDCVFSGRVGCYNESSPHDPTDVYGRTKSLGEVRSPAVRHLRCSIIGPEPTALPRPVCSLFNWFLGQPQGATVQGYTNHRWNGITTYHFAKLCHGIMSRQIELPHVQHIIPYTQMTKAALLKRIAIVYNRMDIKIVEAEAPAAIDRTLNTCDVRKNFELWRAAGYGIPASVHMMVSELAVYSHSEARQ